MLKKTNKLDYVDLEWLEAQDANEEEEYFFVKKGKKCGTIIKKYKPSVARLITDRTGWKLVRVNEVIRLRGWQSRHKPVERRFRGDGGSKRGAFIFDFGDENKEEI